MPMGIGPGLSVTRGGSVTGIGAIGADLALWFDENQAYKSSGGGIVTPDSILTYTAPSPKLVYGSDGVLGYAPHNLLLRSEEFDNAAWTKTRATITANAIAAPNGTLTADKLVEDSTAASSHKVEVSLAFRAVTYTLSAYLKAGERTWAAMQFVAVSGAPSAYFDLTNGVVGTVGAGLTASIVDAGNGWYRCIVTGLATAVTAAVSFFIAEADNDASINGDGTSGIYIWGAQLNLGSTLFDYIPTTTAAVYSLPRDYNPTTGAALGVLVEEARTNLLVQSQTFDNAIWSKITSSISANASVAPDGTTTADKFVGTAGSTNIRLQQTVSLTGAVTYTYSIYAKAGEYSTLRVQRQDVNLNSFTHDFDLSAGTASGGGVIQSVGNGWYRCIGVVTCNTTASTGVLFVAQPGATGDTTSGLFIWGAQLE